MKRPRRLRTRLLLSYILQAFCITLIFSAGTGLALFLQMRNQLAHFAIQDIEIVEGLLALDPSGGVVLRDDYHNHAESKKVLDHYIEVLSPEGTVLYRNDRLGNSSLDGSPFPSEGVGGYSERWVKLADGTRAILVSRRHVLAGRPILIRLAQTAEPVWRASELFGIAAAIMFPLVITAALFAAWRMSWRLLAPVQEIATRAGEITSSRLHERIPVHGNGDEIDQLAVVFNQMLSRLDESFRQLRQFTSDASHELRTPLAAIRAIGEVGLDRNRSSQEYRDLVGSMLEEVNRLTRLVEDLLMISRAESRFSPLSIGPIAVSGLVKDTLALLEPLAEEKNQKFEVSGVEDAVVQGDAVFLRQALINVVHNAIKFSPLSTTVSVNIQYEQLGYVVVSVLDRGAGIAPEHTSRIFDRFYRADSGRSREAGGFGLGLAISQWAVEAHNGSITVSSLVGQGSTFFIRLPYDPSGQPRS